MPDDTVVEVPKEVVPPTTTRTVTYYCPVCDTTLTGTYPDDNTGLHVRPIICDNQVMETTVSLT